KLAVRSRKVLDRRRQHGKSGGVVGSAVVEMKNQFVQYSYNLDSARYLFREGYESNRLADSTMRVHCLASSQCLSQIVQDSHQYPSGHSRNYPNHISRMTALAMSHPVQQLDLPQTHLAGCC